MDTLNNYTNEIERELEKVKAEKAVKERRILRLEEILSRAKFYYEKEKKRCSARFKKSVGETVAPNRTAFKKSIVSNVPEKETPTVAGGAVEVPEEKKSSWSLF